MKKILIIIPVLSVLLLFSNLSVKANEVVFPAFPEPVEGKSSTHYLITFNSVTGDYFLIKPLNPQTMNVTVEGNNLILNFAGPAISYIWKAGEGGNSWITQSTELGFSTKRVIISGYNEGTEEFLYSSFDLYYSDGSIFFQRAPIKVNFSTQMKRIQMGAVLETVAKMVPVVMIAVAGFLGFRKAFNLLLKVFHQA